MKKYGIVICIGALALNAFAEKKKDAGKFYLPEWSTAPLCTEKPDFLLENKTDVIKTLSGIPKVVLVARQAEFYVEGTKNKKTIRLYASQHLLNAKSKGRVICGEAPGDLKDRLSLSAPTLIDNQKIETVGQSLWQFQILVDAGRFSFWNLKKPSIESLAGVEKEITDNGATYKINQRSHDEYELILTKKTGDLTLYLAIRYDAVSRIK